MRQTILLFAIALLLSVVPSRAAQNNNVALENPPYGYSYSFGDDESTGAYLGVDISDITPERLSALKLKDEHGVEVTIVDQDAPAGKAGLKEHDVILTMNGTGVESGAQLRRMIRETPPNRVVTLGISRDGQPLALKVQLGDRRKSTNAHMKDYKFEMPAMPPMPDMDVPVSVVVVHSSLRSGLMVENITPQLGDFFGVKNGKGVLVRSVEKGSRADKAGFRAGDVIVKVNEQAVQDTSDFSHALRSRNQGNAAFVVIREKKEQNLSMPLPEQKDSSGMFEEESSDLPEYNAENFAHLAAWQTEMAQLKPEMELAVRKAQEEYEKVRPEIEKAQQAAKEEIERHRADIDAAQKVAREEIEKHRADIEAAQKAAADVQKEFCEHQKEIRDAVRKQQTELRHQFSEKQKQLLDQQRKQMDRMRHEMKGDWLEI